MDTTNEPANRLPLSRPLIVATAVALADAHGVAGVSMRKLANELGYEVMSLYNHVANKDDLLDAMVESVASELDAVRTSADLAMDGWRATARQLAVEANRALLRHRWASALWSTRWPGPARWRHMEALLAALAAADLPADVADLGFHAITLHVQGFTRQQVDFASAHDLGPSIDRVLREVSPQELPHLTRHIRYHLESDEHHDEFGFVLDLILDGLARVAHEGRQRIALGVSVAPMFTRPDDVTDADVVAALVEGWGLSTPRVEYAAVGYGSHHWRVTDVAERWFVSVDDLDARRRLATDSRHDARNHVHAALRVARSLSDAGLSFVVAPRPTITGAVLHPLQERYVIALYGHVDGVTHPFGPYPTRVERLAVLDLVVALHGTDTATVPAVRDDFVIPSRDALIAALDDLAAPWGPGPFAAGAQQLVREHREALELVLARYDELAGVVAARPERMVITHGEPHRGNTIDTPSGVVLIDWDTALLAPRERDLWTLIDEDPAIADEYERRTGIAVDDVAIQLYRLWWDLCEIALFVADLRRPHRDTADMRVAWEQLTMHLDPARWQPRT